MNKIYLKGANNARDFGGIKNEEGKAIKDNLFLRSNALHKLNKKDVETLKAKNLRTVIDLRTYVEKDNNPNVKIDGVIALYCFELIILSLGTTVIPMFVSKRYANCSSA